MKEENINKEVQKQLVKHLSNWMEFNEKNKAIYLSSIHEFKNNLMEDLLNRYESTIDSNDLLSEDCIDLEYKLDQLREQVTDAKIKMAQKREYQLEAANLENLIKVQPDNIQHQENLENIKRQISFIDIDHEGWEEIESEMIELEEEHRVIRNNNTLKSEKKSILERQKKELNNYFENGIWKVDNISKNGNLTTDYIQNQITKLQNELGISVTEKNIEQKKEEKKVEQGSLTILDIALPSDGYVVIKTNPSGDYGLLVEDENFHTGEVNFFRSGKSYQNFEKLIRDLLSTKLSKGYPSLVAPGYTTYLKTVLNEQILNRLNNDSEALHDDFFEDKPQYQNTSLLKLWEIKLNCKFNFEKFQFQEI